MNSFRKHAPESTRRPDSVPARGAKAAVLLGLLLVAQAGAFAAPRQQPRKAQDPPFRVEEQPYSVEAPAAAEEARIPIRVRRVETADGPGIVATIGEFPADLEEAGQEFLKREFFERFAADVLGLGESVPGATVKVALLPQEKENQREGDFRAGKVSGHMVVLVEKRRVLVACTFSESGRKAGMLASAAGVAAAAAAGE